VSDGTEVDPPGGTGWGPVVTEAEAVAELTRLSRAGGRPSGIEMAGCLPRPDEDDAACEEGCRALRWKTDPSGPDAIRMWTWRKQWQSGSWQPLLGDLAGAARALSSSNDGWRAFPLMTLRAFDDDGVP